SSWTTTPDDQIALSHYLGVVPTGSDTGAADITLGELGLNGIGGSQALRIVGYSANRGLKEESVWTRATQPGTDVYAIVMAPNGGFSLNPYTIQVETSAPRDLSGLYKTACAPTTTPLVSPPTPTATSGNTSSPTTLILTQT